MDDAFRRSERIKASWTDGEARTHEEKTNFWHAYARDVAAGFKSSTARIVHAITCASWAWAKAARAETHIADLERRLRALELKTQSLERGFSYEGVYREGEQYEARSFVTHDGSMWYCAEATSDRPGDSGDWVLAVKHGRDLRDRRR